LKPLEAADEVAKHLDEVLAIFTIDNIEAVLYETKQMIIDSAESLRQCVDVIFEKAINNESQTNFSILCAKLFLPSVPVAKDSNKMITFKEQIHEKASTEVQNFLEKQTLENLRRVDNKIDQKKNAKEKVDDENELKNSCHRRIRDVIALFRFLGELYLIDFLPSTFIANTLSQLLNENFCNENCLESFWALLKISGGKLELTDAFDLSEIFKVLEKRKASVAISPHTRFMIEEIFAMRKNRWDPVSEIDFIMLYNLFLFDVEEKLYIIELWYGK
jgi:hypothetical protein